MDESAACGEALADVRNVDGESRSASADKRGRLMDGSGLDDCRRFETRGDPACSTSDSGRTTAEAIALHEIS